MSSNYQQAVNAFLHLLGITRIANLNRIWQAFMAYSMCIVTQAFRQRHYGVTPMNCSNGFRFKCFPQGNPNDYSYFIATKEVSFEVRLNIYCQNLRWSGLRLNLDVVIIHEGSIDATFLVDSNQNLVSFVECKNLRGFPELVAGFEGIVFEQQQNRLYRGSISNFNIPACLFLSQSGHSIMFMDRRYQSANKSMRIFDMLHPGSPNVQSFIQTWF